jgi:hypothetical protein
MRRAAPILLTFAVLLFTATEGLALPPCPEDQSERYHNCYGTYTFADGEKHVGEWRDDEKHGQGTFTWANGDKYVGEYRDDKRNGQGTYTTADGHKYVGEFRDGKRNGHFTVTYSSGGKPIAFRLADEHCESMGKAAFYRGATGQYGPDIISSWQCVSE